MVDYIFEKIIKKIFPIFILQEVDIFFPLRIIAKLLISLLLQILQFLNTWTCQNEKIHQSQYQEFPVPKHQINS